MDNLFVIYDDLFIILDWFPVVMLLPQQLPLNGFLNLLIRQRTTALAQQHRANLAQYCSATTSPSLRLSLAIAETRSIAGHTVQRP